MMNALLLYPAWLLCLGVALALVLRRPVRPWVAALAGAVGLAAFLAYPILNPPKAIDLEWFWKGGTSLRAGESPYDNSGCQNPPTVFPLYLAVSSFPLATAQVLWTVVLLGGALLLVEVARRALAACGDETARNLGWPLTLLLTALVCLSRTTRYGLDLGQLAVPIALCAFMVVWAWGRQQRLFAGAGLALTSIKTPTMLPLLLLFPRWKDRLTWLAAGAAGLLLVLSTTPPTEILPRCQECLRNIAANRQPGRIDDASLAGSNTSGLIGVGMLVHRLGVPAGAAGAVEGVLLLALAGWVLWCVAGPRRVSRPAAACLVLLFASVFLYHRHYDMVLLALPLVYVAGRVHEGAGARRGLYALVGVCILIVFNVDIWTLSHLGRRVVGGESPEAWLLRALVLPCMTWLNLLAMALLVRAERVGRTPGADATGLAGGAALPAGRLRRELALGS